MIVRIDPYAGFCTGVKRTVKLAEQELQNEKKLFCLGEIVHNGEETHRLEHLGLVTIGHDIFNDITSSPVLFRAHGEPPESYQKAEENHLRLIDATCPVVKKLQRRISESQQEMEEKGGIIIIFGKKTHPEMVGLMGQTGNQAVAAIHEQELDFITLSCPVRMYAQTTMDADAYKQLQVAVLTRMKKANPGKEIDFKAFNTICGQVSNRAPKLREFAQNNEVIIFISGKNSSNGKYLYGICNAVNTRSYWIAGKNEVNMDWFRDIGSVGISGATSTPSWLLEEIAEYIGRT